jgi:maltose alpha-D-glucosyltransferase/alpha-amylase
VHPDYGSLADAKRFIAEAHKRGLRVITELVINHTSDQHPWFQRARQAKRGSKARDFYVWSDDDQKYDGTRIIFLDTEKSNWTWDPVAGQYFWHRFYSHQPDLNFDNPQVLKAVIGVMRFWLDMGIDGLRLDAIPYLIERDGTNNENLPRPTTSSSDPRRDRRQLPRPHAAGRGQPVAGRHPVLRRRRGRRMPHGLPLPADAAHVHGPGQEDLPDHRHPAPDPGDSRQLPVGDLPAQPR